MKSMNTKEWLRREKYVALHAQTLRFRVVKYLVLLTLALALYFWKGIATVGYVFLVLFVVAIGVHFLFRWKTDAWTKSWGPYKKLDRLPCHGVRERRGLLATPHLLSVPSGGAYRDRTGGLLLAKQALYQLS